MTRNPSAQACLRDTIYKLEWAQTPRRESCAVGSAFPSVQSAFTLALIFRPCSAETPRAKRLTQPNVYSSQSQKPGSPRSGCWLTDGGPLPDGSLLTVSSLGRERGERGRKSADPDKRTNPIMGCTSTTSPNPNYLPKHHLQMQHTGGY